MRSTATHSALNRAMRSHDHITTDLATSVLFCPAAAGASRRGLPGCRQGTARPVSPTPASPSVYYHQPRRPMTTPPQPARNPRVPRSGCRSPLIPTTAAAPEGRIGWRLLSRGSTRWRVTREGRELGRARRSCFPRNQASGLVRPSLSARSCLRPNSAVRLPLTAPPARRSHCRRAIVPTAASRRCLCHGCDSRAGPRGRDRRRSPGLWAPYNRRLLTDDRGVAASRLPTHEWQKRRGDLRRSCSHMTKCKRGSYVNGI